MKAIYAILVSVMLAGLATIWAGHSLETDTTKAIEFGARLNHQRNEQLLERLFDESLANILNIVQETSRSTDLLFGILSNNKAAVEGQLGNVLSRHSGERIDALVIETAANGLLQASSFSILESDLNLKPLIDSYQPYNRWKVVRRSKTGKQYIVLRNVQPVIDPATGEVVAKLNVLIMLNDNFWVMSEILGVLGASEVSLIHRGDKLGALQTDASPALSQESPNESSYETEGPIRQYLIAFGTEQRFRLSVRQKVDDSAFVISLIHQWRGYLTITGVIITFLALTALIAVRRQHRRYRAQADINSSKNKKATSTP